MTPSVLRYAALLFAAGALLPLRAGDPPRSFDPANFDESAKPCEDFYQHACGGWIKNNPIPADKPGWGTFYVLYDRNRDILKGTLVNAAAKRSTAPLGSPERKVGDYFASCLDEAGADEAGLSPIRPALQMITGLKNKKELLTVAGKLQRQGVNAIFGFGSETDAKNSNAVIASFGQAGLGLPERDYYLKETPDMKKIRVQYLAHVGKMFKLLGESPALAAQHARGVFAVEKRLAQASMPQVELRNPDNTYNKTDLKGFQAQTAGLDWSGFLGEMGFSDLPEVNVDTPSFFKALPGIVNSTPLPVWKSYLRWQLAHAHARYLSKAISEESFAFYGTILSGQPKQEPREKRCISASGRELGEMLGQTYVDAAFSPESKARMRKMVDNLYAALRSDIPSLVWMDDATKAQALKKLAAFNTKIGYPDSWRDYSTMAIRDQSWAANHVAAAAFEYQRDLNKIGKPVDRAEWGMTPATVNAYYSAEKNEIVFPAGILQPPFFDPREDDAYNYGAIGMVIGHEITHGFDDEGRKFDEAGNLHDWWSADSAKNFESRGKCMIDQYSAYEPVPGAKVKGDLTLGENIADLGGLKIAYRALELSFGGNPPPPKDGYTWQQRFFLGAASAWCENERPESIKQQVNTDPHSPGKYRMNGPMSNLPEFQKAFNCPAGAPMVKAAETVCQIW